MKELWTLFLTFCRIGGLTFGGGYAMVALLQNEFVEEKKWVTKEEFLDLMKQENKTYKDYKNTSGLISLAVKAARLFGMEKRQYR